jgi:hypothetical protein
MSDEQFVIWLRGFSEAVRTTPSVDQWERVKEKLSSVQEHAPIKYPAIGIPIAELSRPYVPYGSPGIMCKNDQIGSMGKNDQIAGYSSVE